MKDKDQKLIWESYLTELVGDPDDQKHGIPASPNIDAANRAAAEKGPDPNIPKHGQSDANLSDFDPYDTWQNKMRKAVQDLEDLPTNATWNWTDDGGAMDWLVKRLDFTNARDESGRKLWDGTDGSMPEELQKWDGKGVLEVVDWLQDRILEALYRSSDTPEVYAKPEGADWNPTDVGKAAVKGVFDNAQQIRTFHQHWKGKRSEAAKKEPGIDAITGGRDKHDNPKYRLD